MRKLLVLLLPLAVLVVRAWRRARCRNYEARRWR